MSDDLILVRPPDPVTPSIARVFVDGAAVKIFFPEKREDYNLIVKEYFRYGWQRPYRVRTFADDTVADRAAEVINHLLVGGFCVKADKALVDAAVSGEFAPEPRRWVKVFTGGKHEGWFAVGWMKDENLYHAAKRIPGARYDKPRVAGEPCPYCVASGKHGILEQRVGAIICDWCGRTQYEYTAVTFDALDDGERFYSAGEKPDEAKVFVKGASPVPSRHDWYGSKANAYQEDAPDLYARFAPGSHVVLA